MTDKFDLEFESYKNWNVYFPYNNIDEVITN